MTKQEILSDLKFIVENYSNLMKEAKETAPEHVYAYAFGVLSAMVNQVAEEIPIKREFLFK